MRRAKAMGGATKIVLVPLLIGAMLGGLVGLDQTIANTSRSVSGLPAVVNVHLEGDAVSLLGPAERTEKQSRTSFSTSQSGGTVVGGPISSDTTWTAMDSPYVVTSNVIVNPDVTLTIEPGVTVRFESGKALWVDGELIARGTEGEFITFTSNQASPVPGDWVNIVFPDSSVDAAYDSVGNYISGSILQYCTVEYGGGGPIAAIVAISSSPLIDRCRISNGAGGGIYVGGGAPKLVTNVISGNSGSFGGGIHVDAGEVSIAGNEIFGNYSLNGGGIYIAHGSVADITGNTIRDNASMIHHNVGAGGGIFSGSSAVTIRDNLVTGNSARMGGGLFVSAATITGNTIHGNSATESGGGIYTSGTVTIDNNDIRENSAPNGGGICIRQAYDMATLVLFNCIVNNHNSGITVRGSSTTVSAAIVNQNNIYGNDNHSMENLGSILTPDVDATGNWWGTTDEAAIEDSIHDWNDDASLGRIIYQPIATTPIPGPPPVQHCLTVSSTVGGAVTDPGEGEFGYDEGMVVGLLAVPQGDYEFVSWTGDIDTIADPTSASTNITMWDAYEVTAVFEALAQMDGQTSEVNCTILPGVTVTLYSDDYEIGSTVSNDDGYYTLAVPGPGEYKVVASKDGVRDRERTISVTEPVAHTVDFVGDHGLVPNAPDMSYVLACINLWQFGEPSCKLTMSTVLAVINAWQFPTIRYDLTIFTHSGRGQVNTPHFEVSSAPWLLRFTANWSGHFAVSLRNAGYQGLVVNQSVSADEVYRTYVYGHTGSLYFKIESAPADGQWTLEVIENPSPPVPSPGAVFTYSEKGQVNTPPFEVSSSPWILYFTANWNGHFAVSLRNAGYQGLVVNQSVSAGEVYETYVYGHTGFLYFRIESASADGQWTLEVSYE